MDEAGSPIIGVSQLDRAGLEAWLVARGEPRFRTGQLIRWLYQRSASSYEEMTDLPSALRRSLAEELPVARPVLESCLVSALDDTRRYLWRLSDSATVESVGLPTPKRLTVCFSVQAGCAMECTFCATGKGGFVRNLGPGEMVEQVRLTAEDYGRRATNAVAMGQGEPFMNYAATLGALRLMNDADGLAIGARRLTISTCGVLEGITRLASEPEQFTLAVSLHSAVQSTRDRIMPALRGQPVSRLKTVLADYVTRTGRRPSIEYALMQGVNDSDRELAALIGFCRDLGSHVNLMPVNEVPAAGFSRPPAGRVELFASKLTEAGIEASVRAERGSDIEAACGQLTQRHSQR